jgi:hypothetical protein
MKNLMFKSIALNILVVIGLGGFCQADTKKDDLIPNMKLEVAKSDSKSNPKLKQGKGCENLEELQGETFDDYPMAKTIPCETVDCQQLEPAVLHDDNFKELPTAKTDGSCEEE